MDSTIMHLELPQLALQAEKGVFSLLLQLRLLLRRRLPPLDR